MDSDRVVLTGDSLTIEQLVRVARDPRVQVSCAPAGLDAVARGWGQIKAIVADYQAAVVAFETGEDSACSYDNIRSKLVYGVTTGFGEFKRVPVDPKDLETLQQNLLLSHAVGVGENTDIDDLANYFPAEVVRGALLLRLNAFLKGNSGVRPALVTCVQALINEGIVPLVPLRGSLGASGDLCPLAHVFVVLLSKGRYYHVNAPDDLHSRSHVLLHACDGLRARDGARITLPTPAISYKEGLALTNGANFSAAMLALAVHDAQEAANTADVAAALTLEAMIGRYEALEAQVHKARGHRGQADSAINIRTLVAGSSLRAQPTDDVQDAYSLRCAPQVHGATRDSIAYACMVAQLEINSATDNPLFFENDPKICSAGNFHGQPVALAADFLAIAVAELANISERRTQMLLDSNHNRGLPGNLIPMAGLNSGYMIAQYTAASLVSENKVLAHPASVDSIPTSANSEDHVSMAPIATRKLRTILANTQAVLAVELLVATQAAEWRVAQKSTEAQTEKQSGDKHTGDKLPKRPIRTEIENWKAYRAAERALFEEIADPARVANLLGVGTREAYRAVRERAPRMVEDRMIDEDIQHVRKLVTSGEIVRRVRGAAKLLDIPALVPGARPGD